MTSGDRYSAARYRTTNLVIHHSHLCLACSVDITNLCKAIDDEITIPDKTSVVGKDMGTRVEQGQRQCCKRKSDGCECMSDANGACRPKCDDYLGIESKTEEVSGVGRRELKPGSLSSGSLTTSKDSYTTSKESYMSGFTSLRPTTCMLCVKTGMCWVHSSASLAISFSIFAFEDRFLSPSTSPIHDETG